MKTLFTLLVGLFFFTSCKPDPAADPSIDAATLEPLLKGYFDYDLKPIDYFKSKVNCPQGHMALAKCFIEKKDEKTLKIQFVYVGKCSGLTTNPGNDYEIKAILECPMPVKEKDSDHYRIDFKGTINSTFPANNELLNKQIDGLARLTPFWGLFTVNLPVSVDGKRQQIISNMNIRGTRF